MLKQNRNTEVIYLGKELSIEEVVKVARYGARVEFSNEYMKRINKSRDLVEKWINEERVMYGITTGFGALYNKTISIQDSSKLQRNIVLSHSTSVGESLSIEEVRAIMLMVLQVSSKGYTGIRLETLEMYKEFLNRGLTPYAPKEGSVGYLCIEAHIATVLLGEGRAYVSGDLLSSKDALERVGLKPIELASKEGLILTNGTLSPTGIATLTIYDMLKATKTADIIGAMTLEVSKGTIKAFDERVMSVRKHVEQKETALNIRTILNDSEIIERYKDYKLQDALSIRCIPQLHGAVKKTLSDALVTIENAINSCSDNPIIWSEDNDGYAISSGNPDSSYIGLEMDSSSIAATMLAKMSERRNNRLIDSNLSGYPWFLMNNPGLNSGLMIPQYTQAGLLNDMRILSHPASVDNVPTCGNQEDYVAMGYNAAKKARQIVDKLEYILAIELLSAYQAYQFIDKNLKPSTATTAVLHEIEKHVPILDEDLYLYPHINKLKDMIHSGEINTIVEDIIR